MGCNYHFPSAPTPARSFTSTWEWLRSARITSPSGRMLGAALGRLSATSWNATDSSTPSIPAMNQRRRCRLTRHWPSWRNCNRDILGSRTPEVGERHDALSYIKGSSGIIVPVPTHSLGLEEPDFFGSEIGDMKSATAELSKRNGSEPPKDLNKAH